MRNHVTFKSFFSLLLLVLSLGTNEGFAQAANEVVISPNSLELLVSAGDSITSSFSIQNISDNSITLDVHPVLEKTGEESSFFISDDFVFSMRADYDASYPQLYRSHVIQYSISKNEVIDTLYTEDWLGWNNVYMTGAIAYYKNQVFFGTNRERNLIKVVDVETKEVLTPIQLPHELEIESLAHSGQHIYVRASYDQGHGIYKISPDSGDILDFIDIPDGITNPDGLTINGTLNTLYMCGIIWDFGAIYSYNLETEEWDTNLFNDENYRFYECSFDRFTNLIVAYGFKNNEYQTRDMYFIDPNTSEIILEQRIDNYKEQYEDFFGLALNESGFPNFFNWLNQHEAEIIPSESHEFEYELNAKDLYVGEYATRIEVFNGGSIDPISTIPVSISITGSSKINVQPSQLIYEDIFIGDSTIHEMSIVNEGSDRLIISEISFSNSAFYLDLEPDYPLIIAPNSSNNLGVMFKPISEGLEEGTIEFATNDVSEPVYSHPISGRGLFAPQVEISPESFSFFMNSFELEEQTFSINNIGGHILNYRVFGSGDPARSITKNENEFVYFSGDMWFNAPDPPYAIFEYHLGENSITDTLAIDYELEHGFRNIAMNDGLLYFDDYVNNVIQVYDLEEEKIVNSFTPELGSSFFGLRTEFHDGHHLILSRFVYGEDLILYKIDDSSGKMADSLIITNFPRDFGQQFTINLADSSLFYQASRTIYKIDLTSDNNHVHVPILELFDYDNFLLGNSAPRNSLLIYATKNNRAGFYILEYSFEKSELLTVVYDEHFRGPYFNDIATNDVAIPGYIELASEQIDSISVGASKDFTFRINTDNLIEGSYMSNLYLLTNDPTNRIKQVPIELEVSGVALISAHSDSISFGPLLIGESVTKYITLKNVGTKVLDITGFELPDKQFSIPDSIPLVFTLQPLDSIEIPITYEPTESNQIDAQLIVLNDSENSPELSITMLGSAITPANIEIYPESFTFNPDTNEVLNLQFYIENTGEQTLEFGITPHQGSSPDVSILQNQNYYTIDLFQADRRNSIYYDLILEYSRDSKFPVDTLYKKPGRGNFNGLAYHNGLIYFLDREYRDELQVLDIETKALLEPLPISDNFTGGFYSLSHDGENLIGSYSANSGVDLIIRIDGTIGGIIDTLYSGTQFDRMENITVNTKVKLLYRADFNKGIIYAQPIDSPSVAPVILANHTGYDGFQEISYSSKSNSILVVGREEGSSSYKLIEFNAIDGSVIGTVENDSDYVRSLATDESSGYNYLTQIFPLRGQVENQDSILVNFQIDSRGVIEGDYLFDFTIVSNDLGSPSVTIPGELQVMGVPELSVNKAPLTFESIFTGDTLSQQLVVRNIGTKNTDIVSITISNDQFYLQGIPDRAFVLGPKESIVLYVVFAPTEEGVYDPEILIQSNSLENNDIIIPVVAEALDPPIISFSPDRFDMNFEAGDTTSALFSINNMGGSDLNYQLKIDYSDTSRIGKSDFFASVLQLNPVTNAYYSQIVSLSWETDSIIDTLYTYDDSHSFFTSVGIDAMSYRDGFLYFQTPHNKHSISILDVNKKEVVKTINLSQYSDYTIQSFATHPEGLLISVFDEKDEKTILFLVSLVNGETLHILGEKDDADVFSTITSNVKENEFYGVENGRIMTYSLTSANFVSEIGLPTRYFIKELGYSSENNSIIAYATETQTYTSWVYHFDRETLTVIDSLSLNNHLSFSTNINPISIATKEDRPAGYIHIEQMGSLIREEESESIRFTINTEDMNSGTYQPEFVIASNDPTNMETRIPFSINVNGIPNIYTSRDSLNFTSTIINTKNHQSVKLINTGSAPLLIEGFETQTAFFELPDTSTVYEIPSGQAMLYPVTHTPNDSIGFQSDRLTFTTNTDSLPVYSIELNGTSINGPKLNFDYYSLEFELPEGDSTGFSLSLSNTGDSGLYVEVVPLISEPFQAYFQNEIPEKRILVVQDQLSWYSDVAELISGWFTTLSVAQITSSELAKIHLSEFDVLMFISDQNNQYYSRLDSNLVKIADFAMQGGTVFYSSANREGMLLVGGTEGIDERTSVSYSGVNPDYFLAELDSVAIEIISSRTTFEELPNNTVVLLETDTGNPVIVEYRLGVGQVFAAGLPIEYYLTGLGENPDIIELYKQFIRYVINLDYSPDWMALDKNFVIIDPDEVVDIRASIQTEGLDIHNYYTEIAAFTNSADPHGEHLISDVELVVTARTDSELESEIPDEFSLSQNYPNPFNPSTSIRIGLPESSKVELVIYNLLGQKVQTIVNQRMNAGFHTIRIDMGVLASGIYIYQVKANDYTETKKLMLIK